MDPVDPSKPGGGTQPGKRGPGRLQLEDTHLGEVAGTPRNWLGGGAEPQLPDCCSGSVSPTAGEPVNELAAHSANESLCLSDTYNTGWGPLVELGLLQDTRWAQFGS